MADLVLNGNNANINIDSASGGSEIGSLPTSNSKLYVPGQEGLVTPSNKPLVLGQGEQIITPKIVGFPNIIIRRIPDFWKLKGLHFDLDGTAYNSIGILQHHFMQLIEKIGRNDLSTEALESRERNIKRLEWLKKQLIEAVENGREPSFPDFNDNSDLSEIIDSSGPKTPRSFEERLKAAEYDIQMAKHDLDMLKEQRDTLLEIDGKKPSGAPDTIPYYEIYSPQYWHLGLERDMKLVAKTFGPLAGTFTAHNGIDDMHGREFDEKTAPYTGFGITRHEGLRFHKKEHVEMSNEYRPRNDKGAHFEAVYGLTPEQIHGNIMFEDTLEVCRGLNASGFTVVYVNRKGTSETDGFYTVYDIHYETIIKALTDLNFASDDDYVFDKLGDDKQYRKVI